MGRYRVKLLFNLDEWPSLYPRDIFIFARCGLAADLSFLIDFYGLTLFAAGGLNMVASTTAADAFSIFRPFSVSCRLISSSSSDQGVVLRQPVA